MQAALPVLLIILVSSPALIGEAVITRSGVVEVRLVVGVSEGLNEVRLPVEPLVETLEARVGGRLIVPLYEGGSLYLFTRSPGEAEITYLANVTSRDSVYSFRLLGGMVKIIAEPGVVLLTPPERVVEVGEREGVVELVIEGPGLIEYAVRRAAPPPPEVVQIQTPPAQETRTPEEVAEPEEPPVPAWAWLVVPAVVVVAAILVVVIARRGRRGAGGTAYLTETDREILEELRRMGGEAMQAELQKRLAMPKTSLWRHVKKLERLGLVEIEKTPEGNKIKARG